MAEARKRLEEESSSTKENTDSPPKSPVRRLVSSKSDTLHGSRSSSDDKNQRSPVRKLVGTKSGTLHGMKKAAAEAKKSDEESKKAPVRKLVVAKSGTLHGMRKGPTSTAHFGFSPSITKGRKGS